MTVRCMPPWYWFAAATAIVPAVIAEAVAGEALSTVFFGAAAALMVGRGWQLRRLRYSAGSCDATRGARSQPNTAGPESDQSGSP